MSANNIKLPHPNYRPDIDGLRAIAIISVVVFHAYRDFLPGGFIGVDVFFVISGFLISTILLTGLENNQFSIQQFYVRRVRRIFPALITVIIASIFLAWYFLFSDELERFGRHLTAGITFLSNIIFWRESGYFDSASETKPLLHFWSLAIEEQFYLFWPLLLAFLWDKKIGLLRPILLIAVLSFTLNIIVLKDHPVAAFFLPFTRVWELIIGGLLAYFAFYRPNILNQYKNVQSLFGLTLLTLGFVLTHEGSDFPGWWALLPTVGTFFIILAGANAWPNKKLLSNHLMIWVGNISYPLYLWHWPLLSFAFVITNGQISDVQLLGILLLALLLSWLTFRFVENPVRFGQNRHKAIPIMIYIMLGLLVVALLMLVGKITPRNDSDELQTFIAARNDNVNLQSHFIKVSFNQEKFYYAKNDQMSKTVLIGDSHALQYAPRIAHLLDSKQAHLNTFYLAIHEGCLPVPTLKQFAADFKERTCNDYRNSILELLEDTNTETIILAGCWNCYLIQDKTKTNGHMETNKYAQEPIKSEILENLKHFLIDANKDKKVYLVLDNPIGISFDPSNYLIGSRLSGFSVNVMPESVELDSEQKLLREQLLDIAKEARINIIDPIIHLCAEGNCKSLDDNGLPIYKDNNHLRASYVEKNASYIDNAVLGAD